MSLSLTISESIEEVIQTFIERVATKYNLNNTELKSLWNGDEVKTNKIDPPKENKPTKSTNSDPPTAVDPTSLLKCNKAELIALCKKHGHKCSGTKTDLVNRLLGKDDTETGSVKGSSDKPKAENKPKSKTVQQAAVKATPVAQKLTANIPNILIRRNKFNNYEHPETGLIFDNDSKIVIGKQKEDGKVEQLDEDSIDQCNAYKFKFKIPNNLDQKSNLLNVKVDELEDEDEIEEDEDEVEKEEELAEEDLLEDEDDLLGDEDEFEEYLSDNE